MGLGPIGPGGGGGGGGGGAADLDGLTFTAVQTGNYIAAAGDMVLCDTSGGGFTITPPAVAASTDELFGVVHETEGGIVTVTDTDLAGLGDHKLYLTGDMLTYKSDGTLWRLVRRAVGLHWAKMTLSAAVTTNTATAWTLIPFDTDGVDNRGIVTDPVTNSDFEILRPGYYDVECHIGSENNVAVEDYYECRFSINGSVNRGIDTKYGIKVAGTPQLTLHASDCLHFGATDLLTGHFRSQSANIGVAQSQAQTFMVVSEKASD